MRFDEYRDDDPSVFEYMLYTDAQITGEARDVGPYSFINTIAHANLSKASAAPAIALRVAFYGPPPESKVPMDDDFSHYHGGDYADEMAAIASLYLGIRLKAGSAEREFRPGGDPLGRPMMWGIKAAPQLPQGSFSKQIERLSKQCSIENLSTVADFLDKDVSSSNAFIKASRLYQEAIWICDSDPELSWLLFCSAIETAASTWNKNKNYASENLANTFPDIFKLLKANNYHDAIVPIGELLAEYSKSTEKFVKFLLTFLPDEPNIRPERYSKYQYTVDKLEEDLRVIYKHRSKYLHAGTAFPLPMCQPPRTTPGEPPPEVPMGLAMQSGNAVWNLKSTPMLLHLFEHIVRGSLLNWWHSIKRLKTNPRL